MVEFGWQEVAGLFVGLLILVGSVVWGLRHSRSSLAAIRNDVARFDAVLRALQTPELRVHPGPVYQHPMVGALPSHSTLVGAFHGFAIRVDLHDPRTDAETYPDYRVRVRVTAPLGQAFDAAQGSGAPLSLDPASFQVRVDARSMMVEQTLRDESAAVDLRGNSMALGQHLRCVMDLARSITIADPAAHAPVPAPAPAPPDPTRGALSNKHVFLLESDPRFAQALGSGLVARGARPRVFEDFQSLIHAAELSSPDLVVLALELPGENGWAVVNRFKKHKQVGAVPLVVTSMGFDEEELQAHRRLSSRAQGYVVKPLSVEDMLDRIASQLQSTHRA